MNDTPTCACCGQQNCPVGDEMATLRKLVADLHQSLTAVLPDAMSWHDDWIRSSDEEPYKDYLIKAQKLIKTPKED